MTIADRSKLILVATLVILANSVDLISTWIVSPNLAYEWNLLQRQFGLGWGGLIGAKLLGGVIAILGYRYYLLNRSKSYPQPGESFSEFRRFIIFGPRNTPLRAQSSRDAWRRLFVNLGYFWAGLQMLVIWVAIDNLLLGYGIVFPLRHISEQGYHVMQSWIVGGLVLYCYFRGNFLDYCRMAATADLELMALPSRYVVPASWALEHCATGLQYEASRSSKVK